MFDQSGNSNSSVCLPKHHCSNGWQFTIDEGEGEGVERKKERQKVMLIDDPLKGCNQLPISSGVK